MGIVAQSQLSTMSTSRTFATSLARLSSTASRTQRTQTQTRAICSLPQSWSSNRSRTALSMRSLVPAPALSSRAFTTTSPRRHGHLTPPKPGEELHVTFIDKDGDEYKFQVSEGDNLLDIAQANDLEMRALVADPAHARPAMSSCKTRGCTTRCPSPRM